MKRAVRDFITMRCHHTQACKTWKTDTKNQNICPLNVILKEGKDSPKFWQSSVMNQ